MRNQAFCTFMAMEVLVWIGFAQSMFSGIILLFVKKEQSLSDKLLTVWLFISAFEFLTLGIDLSRGFIHLSNPFLIFNPLLYFYSKSMIQPNLKLKWIDLLHVLPYFFLKIGSYVFNIELSITDFFNIDNSTWFKMTYGVISILSFIGYSIPSLINVHRHRINLQNEFSTIDSKITLGWLLFVIVFYMIFIITAYLLGIIQITTQVYTYSQLVTFAFLLTMIYIFSFYGLLQEKIYPEPAGNGNAIDEYKFPRLNADEKASIKNTLIHFFDDEKPYLISDLTISMVSQKLNILRHTLTEVLNTEIGKNFYQFVNDYRVEEVKRMLSDPNYKHYSIDAIGYECGFNSKSSFYAVFKKLAGMTPMQFKESLK